MKFIATPLEGAYIIELEPVEDERGFLARTFCREEFARVGLSTEIVQMNHSFTKQKGTVRGMHYQVAPACEAKLVRCVAGKVHDVMVDLRMDSPTFLSSYGVELFQVAGRMVYIPAGFAHGFQAITDNAALIYCHTAPYNPECERGLRFDDPALAIKWPLPPTAVSERDRKHPYINDQFKGVGV
jgi:dTDP-4-dehydrorhamnose 3,5-epimerase